MAKIECETAAALANSAGVLFPKLANRFRVSFHGRLPEQSIDQKDAQTLLGGLAAQIISTTLPVQIFGSTVMPPAPVLNFEPLNHDGNLVLTFEDDTTHVVLRGLELLDTMTGLKILVNKLDGNEGVLESYLFTGLKLKTLAHGDLTYASTRAIYKHLTVKCLHMQRAFFDCRATPKLGAHFNNVFGA